MKVFSATFKIVDLYCDQFFFVLRLMINLLLRNRLFFHLLSIHMFIPPY